jgi:hypothetical protein
MTVKFHTPANRIVKAFDETARKVRQFTRRHTPMRKQTPLPDDRTLATSRGPYESRNRPRRKRGTETIERFYGWSIWVIKVDILDLNEGSNPRRSETFFVSRVDWRYTIYDFVEFADRTLSEGNSSNVGRDLI